MTLTNRSLRLAVLAAVAAFAAACGGAAADEPTAGSDPAAGMCAPDAPDCTDTIIGDPDDDMVWDDASIEATRERARDLLGDDESTLAEADVRVGRRGDETMALTEDYVLGRLTVELDADDSGTYRIVTVIAELPDGPETFQG